MIEPVPPHDPPDERAAGDEPAGNGAAVAALVGLGVAPEVAADYVRRGDAEAAVFDAVLLPERLERTVTPAAIAADGKLSVEGIAELMEAFGLPRPRPSEPVFTREEARVLVELGSLEELWPSEVRLQMARVYGAMLAGIARAELQAFQMQTEPLVREHGGDTAAQLGAIKSAFEQLLPLADPMLVGVHRRWIEHELAQRAVSAAERRAGDERLPGAARVTFLFCDLKDFTAYAERRGDAAAIEAIDRFFDVVARERGQAGHLVKSLGDGAMLVYDDPEEAVAAGVQTIDALRTDALGVHASVHRGLAVARAGDYFGGSVNLAARLLAFAGRDELVASAEVVEACGTAFAWKPAGKRNVRGVARPVSIYRLEAP